MINGQKLKDENGYQVTLFPFEYLYMSQDEGGDYSHNGTYNIDFLGWNKDGRVLKCPFYAPCDLKCVAIWDSSSNNRVYESVEKVHLANGNIDYLTIAFAHDDNPVWNVGDTIKQGEILGHTGTTGNVTGDHTHTCLGQGKYEGYTKRDTGQWDLTNRIHYWEGVFTNDSVIVRGFDHPWHSFIPAPTPTEIKQRKKFKWVLYANKLRKKW